MGRVQEKNLVEGNEFRLLQAEVGEGGVVVGAAAEGPVEFAVGFGDGEIVDGGVAEFHEALRGELPVFVAVGAEPMAGVVVIFVGEAYGDAVVGKCPEFLDQAVVEFLVPFAGEEGDDFGAAVEEFGAVAPAGIGGVGAGDSVGVAGVPGFFGEANFLDSGFAGEGGGKGGRDSSGMVASCFFVRGMRVDQVGGFGCLDVLGKEVYL